ncbi:MAG: clostripain-related cysteine peptidase [Candidatus Hodarchaeota archaeon]
MIKNKKNKSKKSRKNTIISIAAVLFIGIIFASIIPAYANTQIADIGEDSVNNNKEIEILGADNSLTPNVASLRDWTFMVYLDADNDLEEYGIDSINEMEYVGSDSNINVIVQIDRIPEYDSSNGDWTGAARYYITEDNTYPELIMSPLVQSLGEVNMGSASTLQSFIEWGKSYRPAEKYALILWDHGSGVMHGSAPGGVCWDFTNGYDYLTLSELKSVLSQSSCAVDLVGFDACLMGGVEIHYQLKNYVDVIVASEEVEPVYGYPYDDILNYLTTNPWATPQQLGQQIVIKYHNAYPSSYDITQAAANSLTTVFVNRLNNFITDLYAISGSQRSQIYKARANSLGFIAGNGVESYIDLYDFANEIQTYCTGAIDTSAQYLKNSISSIIIEERHSSHNADAHGLSIYFPESISGYYPNYENCDFASDFQWDEFLMNYYILGNIYIDDSSWNNWQWAKSVGWCTGFGTLANPYIIQSKIIDGEGSSEACIGIRKSNRYFKILNCHLYNSYYGFRLSYTNNGEISNSYIHSCQYGIRTSISDNNIISENYIYFNDRHGIYLANSDKNIISDNEVYSNGDHGIYLFHSHSNQIINNNKIHDNKKNGIWTKNSDNNLIWGNIVYENNIGINIEGSDSTLFIIYLNTVNDNTIGILLYQSNNFWILANELHRNWWIGIGILECNLIYAVGNTISDSGCGIALLGCVSCTQSGNTFINCNIDVIEA